MIQQPIPRALTVTGALAAVALAVSVPSLRAGAQPAGSRSPMSHGMAMEGNQSQMAEPAPPGEGMREMPGVKEKRVITVTGSENWDALRGFGKDAHMVEMMTLMMVGGSGMEHMKMRPMKPGSANPAGMAMASEPNASQGPRLAVTVTPNPPVVGENTLAIAVTDASGEPVTGLKLAASVAMTSMDMGTTKPKITESQPGHYTSVVNFAMKGPWRVLLTGSAPGESGVDAIRTALEFNVGGGEKWRQPTAAHTH